LTFFARFQVIKRNIAAFRATHNLRLLRKIELSGYGVYGTTELCYFDHYRTTAKIKSRREKKISSVGEDHVSGQGFLPESNPVLPDLK
jgi:hypothetical protein